MLFAVSVPEAIAFAAARNDSLLCRLIPVRLRLDIRALATASARGKAK